MILFEHQFSGSIIGVQTLFEKFDRARRENPWATLTWRVAEKPGWIRVYAKPRFILPIPGAR